MPEGIYEQLQRWKETKDLALASDICEEMFESISEWYRRDANVVIAEVMEWGRDKHLDDPKAQLNKVIEEVGEIAHEITRNKYGSPELVDAIGDSLVTIIILSDILGRHPIKCLDSAYQEIKNRSGKTENGTFVKEQ